jgi:hypothetical protein
MKDNEKENPAIQQGEFASIHDREKFRPQCRHNSHVKHEVGHRHLAAREKRRDAREQSKCNQKSADKFDDPRDKCEPVHPVTATGKPQKLLSAMTRIRQANDQSHDAVNWVSKSIQRVHAARLMMSIFRVKLDISANFYGKYSAPFLPAGRGFGHAEEGVRLERCGFCLRGFWFMLS